LTTLPSSENLHFIGYNLNVNNTPALRRAMLDSGRPAYDLQCRPITHALANAPVTDQSSRESPVTNNSAQTYSHARYLRV